MRTPYQIADQKMSEATETYRLVQVAYRAGSIGDDQYLAARATHEAALAEYDVAFAEAEVL